jgi:hypothetical protein
MSAQVLPITQPGWVYILSNVAMPGLLKVGQTTRSPEERALELATTGVPTPFEVEVAWPVDDVREAERQAHEALAKFRVSESREWFRVSVPEALNSLGCAQQRRSRSAWWLVRGLVEAVGWLTIAALVIGGLA